MISLKLYICATALLLSSAVISSVSGQDSDLEYETSDWDILKLIHEIKRGNQVFSPFSLKLLLALLYEGANSGTLTYRSFHESEFKFENDIVKLRNKYYNISEQLKELKKSDVYDFDINSKIFLNSNYKLSTKYNERINKYYDTQSENTNFTDAKKAADSINKWINNTTQGKLTQLVKADEIKDAVMLLLNTMVFKGKWESTFNKGETRQGGFHLDKESTVNVEYMEQSGEFEYHESPTLDVKFLKIPYVGRELSMTVMLPNSKSGLNNLIKSINPRHLTLVKYYFDKVHVHVILPKFNFQAKNNFNNILKAMRLQKIFDGSAQFGRLLDAESSKGAPGVFVSEIVQKTGIEVNEEGSTAYTATGVELSNKFGAPEYIFNASNPFVFFIEHEKTNTVLFIGKVENPSKNSPNFQDSTPIQTANRFAEPTVPPPSTISMNLNPTYNQQQAVTAGANNLFHVFDMELMKKLDRRNTGNILVSPLSVKQVLAMVLEGAEGETAHEITVAINSLVRDKNDIKLFFQNILYQLKQNQEGVQFENANRIFVPDKVKPKQQYKLILQQYYQSDIVPVKFSQRIETSYEINRWVKETTKGLIPSLIDSDSIRPETSIILANALYFKGVWEKSFNQETTSRACFYQAAKTKDCNYYTNMMDTIDFYNYAEWKTNDLEVKALEIPYKDNAFSMLILLPKQHELFTRMVNNLAFIYPDILRKLSVTEVRAFIPRFSIEFTEDIARVLEGMDIQRIFNAQTSELPHMIENDTSQYVSNVFHKAKIEVNEEGTIAAAATGFVVIPLMGTSKPIFRADHPFIFFVRHVPTGTILFAGRVMKPEKVEEKREEYPAGTFHKTKPTIQKPQNVEINIKTGTSHKNIQVSVNNEQVFSNTPSSKNPDTISFQRNEHDQPYEATRRNTPQTQARSKINEQADRQGPVGFSYSYSQQGQIYPTPNRSPIRQEEIFRQPIAQSQHQANLQRRPEIEQVTQYRAYPQQQPVYINSNPN